MKKTIALLLAVVMLLALSGCGTKNADVTGTWRLRLELTEHVNQEVAASGGDFADYLKLKDFYIDMIMDISADGSYTFAVDQEATNKTVDQVKSQLITGLTKHLEDMIATEVESAGITVEDILSVYGVDSIEELLPVVIGTDLESYFDENIGVEELISALMFEEETGKVKVTGNELTFTRDDGTVETGVYDPETQSIKLDANIEELNITELVLVRQ